MAANPKRKSCKTPFRIREAAHRLKTTASPQAGSVLSREGKPAKRKRLKNGCLEGTPKTFRLSEKQKKRLPKAMQEAILERHRRMGKKILR